MNTLTIRTAIGHALALHCPRCGGGGILKGWLGMQPTCPTCGLALGKTREGDDTFGAYVVNLIVAELLTAAGGIAFVAWTYPAVPWRAVEVVGISVAAIAPFVTFPFSRTVWIAVELLVLKDDAA